MERAFGLVEEKRQDLVNILRNIIRIDTSVPPGKNYDKMVDYLEPRFKELGFGTERVVIPEAKVKEIPLPLEGPRVNLVATKKVGKEPVTIYAHMDVVPIEQKWTVDPFAGVVKEDRVYGRGAGDMKGSIACLLVALQVMEELDLKPTYDIICTMCTDEEIGVYPGIYHLAKEGYVKGHVLCLEGGAQEPLIMLGAAGMVDVTVTTMGKSCHSGMNFLGVNAVEAMVPILEELMKLKQEVEKRESKIPAMPGMPNAPSDKMTPMFNLDIIKGGIKSNIVPAECTLVINRRYIPEEKYEDVCAEIQQAIDDGKKKSKALDVKVNYCHANPAYVVDPDSKYAKKLREAYKAVLGFKEEDYIRAGISGSTDMAWVAQVLETDKFTGTGPWTMKNISAHSADEYVEIRDLISMTKELVYYLTH